MTFSYRSLIPLLFNRGFIIQRKKNSAGESVIYHFAPNSGSDIDSPSELSAGEIFLKQMAFDVDVFI